MRTPADTGIAAGRQPSRAVLVIGDDRAGIAITGVSIESGQADVVPSSFGVVCTQGNLRAFTGPVPPPNTRLENVAIGGRFETGLIVTGRGVPALAGWNLSVANSNFHEVGLGICARRRSLVREVVLGWRGAARIVRTASGGGWGVSASDENLQGCAPRHATPRRRCRETRHRCRDELADMHADRPAAVNASFQLPDERDCSTHGL